MLRLTSAAATDRLIEDRRVALLEDRRVAALRQLDQRLVGASLFAVVADQLRAQPPRLHADDRIGARIERVFLAEHLHADDVFLQLVPAARDRLEHDELQEPLELVALLERRAGEDALELLPDGIVGLELRGGGRGGTATHARILSPYPVCRQRVSRVKAMSRQETTDQATIIANPA